MNVFQYIERYKKANSCQTYGDILNMNKPGFNYENTLNDVERQEHDALKNSDRQRLLAGQQGGPEAKPHQPRKVNISGIGEIIQVC